MPARSKNQRIVAAIAEHEPEKLYARNKGMAKMKTKDLHDFASTSEKNLPTRITSDEAQRKIKEKR